VKRKLNKVLKSLDEFVEAKMLKTESFNIKESEKDIPKNLHPTSVVSIQKGEIPLLVFACNLKSFWVDVISDGTDAGIIKRSLEEHMKKQGITQVR